MDTPRSRGVAYGCFSALLAMFFATAACSGPAKPDTAEKNKKWRVEKKRRKATKKARKKRAVRKPAKPKHADHEHKHGHPHGVSKHHHHAHPHPHLPGPDGHHHPF